MILFPLACFFSFLIRLRLTWRTDTRNFSFERLHIASDAGNFDLASWYMVIQAIQSGKTPWDTDRYNYGPSWSVILSLIGKISGEDNFHTRFFIVFFLFIMDLATSVILIKFGHKIGAILFILNPISLIISGYHNQIEAAAIFFSILAIWILSRYFEKSIEKKSHILFLAGVFLGIGLTFKHTFLLLPILLAMRAWSLPHRIIVIVVPYTIFFVSFTPYLNTSMNSIYRNVFQYRSYQNFPFYSNFIDLSQVNLTYLNVLFLIILLFVGATTRRMDLLRAFAIFSVAVVTFSPSIANQYLVIPAFGCVILKNKLALLYTVLASIFLMKSPDGLGLVYFSFTNISPNIITLVLSLLVYKTIKRSGAKLSPTKGIYDHTR